MKIVNKKSIFILLLLVICLGGIVLRSTYAKFTSSYTTDDDIVSYRYVFDLDIENIDEYELITVSANSDYIFNIDITNSLDSTINYGVWYGMVSPESEENITVAKLSNSANSTSDKIDSGETKTVSLIIRNETSSSIQVKIGVTNLSGKKIITKEVDLQPKLSQYIENLYEDGSDIIAVDIGGDESNPMVYLNSTREIMLDNNGEYRYYGSNPDNYIWFNDELWRIISVSYVENEGSVLEKRVKIVRNDSIGNFSYDRKTAGLGTATTDNGSSDWSDAMLMMLLNPGYETPSDLYKYEGSLYWNQRSGTCYTSSESATTISCDFSNVSTTKGLGELSKNMIGQTKFYLGGLSDYEGLYADDYYNFERGTIVYSGHSTEWTGYVGVMYPSDYAYAADLSVCTKDAYSYDTDTNCVNNDWLYTGEYQWTISSCLDVSYNIFNIRSTGSVYGLSFVVNGHTVRPVVYLKADVVVAGGSGTSTDPYEIDLS